MFDFVATVATVVLFGPIATNPFLPGFVRTAATNAVVSSVEDITKTDHSSDADAVEEKEDTVEAAPHSEPEVDASVVEAVVEETIAEEIVWPEPPPEVDEIDLKYPVVDEPIRPVFERRRLLEELSYVKTKKYKGNTVRKYARWEVRGQTPPGSEVLSTHSEVRELAPDCEKDPIDTVDIEFDKDNKPVVEPVAQTLKRKRDLAYLGLLDPEDTDTVLKSDASAIWSEFFVDLTGPGQVPFYLIDDVRYIPEPNYPWMLESIYEKSRKHGLCVYATFGKNDEWRIFCRPVYVGDMDEVFLYKIETPTRDEINDVLGFNGDIWLLIGGRDIFSWQPASINKKIAKTLKKGVKTAKGHVPLCKITDLTVKMIRKLQDIMKTYKTVTLRGWERTACLRRRMEHFEEQQQSTIKILNEPPAPKEYRPRLRSDLIGNVSLTSEPDVLIGGPKQDVRIQGEPMIGVGPAVGLNPVSLNLSAPHLNPPQNLFGTGSGSSFSGSG